jgi:hypothetical protein
MAANKLAAELRTLTTPAGEADFVQAELRAELRAELTAEITAEVLRQLNRQPLQGTTVGSHEAEHEATANPAEIAEAPCDETERDHSRIRLQDVPTEARRKPRKRVEKDGRLAVEHSMWAAPLFLGTPVIVAVGGKVIFMPCAPVYFIYSCSPYKTNWVV